MAACLPWEIFPNPPWKTPTHTSRALCLFTVPSTLSLWPPMSYTGALQGRSCTPFQPFISRGGQAEGRSQMCSPGWMAHGLTRQEGRSVHPPSCPILTTATASPACLRKEGLCLTWGPPLYIHTSFSHRSLVNLKNDK